MPSKEKDKTMAATPDDTASSAADPQTPAAKKGKKLGIVGGVVAVVVVAAIGFWVWHNDPSFCNNPVCHDTMSPYVETYRLEDNSTGIDKWGNEVQNTHSMLVVSHAGYDLACLDCHVPSLGQQVGEVITQVSGNYYLPLEEVDALSLIENTGATSQSGKGDEFCLRAGCHDVTRQELTAMTAGLSFNPHAWQHEQNQCSDCHKSHRASTVICTECHSEAKSIMPEGWVDINTANRIEEAIYS